MSPTTSIGLSESRSSPFLLSLKYYMSHNTRIWVIPRWFISAAWMTIFRNSSSSFGWLHIIFQWFLFYSLKSMFSFIRKNHFTEKVSNYIQKCLDWLTERRIEILKLHLDNHSNRKIHCDEFDNLALKIFGESSAFGELTYLIHMVWYQYWRHCFEVVEYI